MVTRLALVVLAAAGAALPASSAACGMPYGSGGGLSKAMLIVDGGLGVPEPAEPTLQERLTDTIDAERAALAVAVAQRVADAQAVADPATEDVALAPPTEKPQS